MPASILKKLEEKLVKYLENEWRHYPDIIYLGQNEIFALDKRFGGIVSEVFNLEIVVVEKSSFVQYGERL